MSLHNAYRPYPLLSGKELYNAACNMDLQWFAAEDEGRTFDPTDITYRKAREEGRVAKSKELIAAIGLLLPSVALIFLAPLMLRTCAEMLRFFFTRITELNLLTDRLTIGVVLNYYLRLVLPLLLIGLIAGIFSNLIQVGFLFTTKPLVPDFTRVIPRFGKFFKKIFSVEGIFNLGKSVFKMLIIGVVAFTIIRSEFSRLVNLQTVDLWLSLSLVASLAARILIVVAVLLLVLSIPDTMFEKWQFKESLKMRRQEAEEEFKQEEGDPKMRQRLKSRYRELLSRNMLAEVPKADVVITNPTHYSVALLFDVSRMNGPMVIAKGEDDVAFQIRDLAKEHGVPVVPHPPLTRTLYYAVELNEEIPSRYWTVVSLVLGKFFNFDQEQKQNRAQKLKHEVNNG